MPLDSLARNTLRVFSGKSQITLDNGEEVPAIKFPFMITAPARVVVVEDEEAVRDAVVRALAKDGYAVVAFADAHEPQAILHSDVTSARRASGPPAIRQ